MVQRDAAPNNGQSRMSNGRAEKILLITLSLFSMSLFFSQSGISIFGPLSLIVLLIWRFSSGYKPQKKLPGYLLVAVAIFMLDVFLGGIMSDNHAKGFEELTKYWNVLLCGLLFTCPMSDRNRKRIVVVFFLAAALAGLMGVLQYFGILFKVDPRAHAFTNAIHYAGILALAGSSAIMMMLIPNDIFRSKMGTLFLALTATLILAGILFSLVRGVWIAFFLSCLIVLLIYSYRRALVFLLLSIALLAAAFSASDIIRQRAYSIIKTAEAYKDDKSAYRNPRYETWKGTFLIYKNSPLLGTGTGDYVEDITTLIEEGKISDNISRVHAHNIYLQWLSTQGIVGLTTMLLLFASLIMWGGESIKQRSIGGYIIVLATLLTIVGGLTENNIGISKYFAAWCFTMGLLGGFGQNHEKETS